MTLYSKWSAGKNITFIGLFVMLISLFIPWLSIGKMEEELKIMTVDQLISLFENLDGLVKAMGGEYVKTINSFKFVYYVNRFRWLFLLPMIYPAVFLFWARARKTVACLSSLVAFLVPLVMFFFAIGIFNAGIWVYIIGALVCFLGCTMDVPVKATAQTAKVPASMSVPSAGEPSVQAVSGKKFCPSCGAQNLQDAKFCESCGKEFPQ